MSQASALSHRHIFGVLGKARNNIHYQNDETVVYMAGHNIVFYNIVEKKQKFIHGAEESQTLSAISIAPSKRYLAVAEKSERAVATIYDLRTMRRRKSLHSSEIKSKEYVSICFSTDNQMLLILSGSPDWTLTCWNWTKAKAVASVQCTLGLEGVDSPTPLSCSFSTLDNTIALVYGNGIFKFYRIHEGEMRQLPASPKLSESKHFTSHAWLKCAEDILVMGTAAGELIVFKGGEFVSYLSASPGGSTTTSFIVPTSQGFVIGCSEANFRMYTYKPNAENPSELFECSHMWKIDGLNANNKVLVTGMTMSSQENSLCVLLNNNQIYQVPFTTPNNIKNEEMKPLIVNSLFHGPGAITGMNTCARKPLVVTCGMDRSIRVWNYLEKRLEIVKFFNDDPLSIGFHPSGLHIVVGFSDKLRILNLQMEDIRVHKEIAVKGCRECQFSRGGHLFAAVNGTSTISIFDFYTCEKIIDLRGHNGKVHSIFWGERDLTLVSCGHDGAVYLWEVDEGKRIGEYNLKGVCYTSAISTSDQIICVGTDKMLKVLELPEVSSVLKYIDAGLPLSSVVLTQNMLFAGTAEDGKPGCVRAYSFPLSGEYLEYPCMGSRVTKVCISIDERQLMVADEDGNLCIFDIKQVYDTSRRGFKDLHATEWSEEILVTKSDLEEKNQLMQELKTKVDELALHNEYKLRLKEMAYAEKIKEVNEKYAQELDQQRSKFDLLREEKSDMEMEYDDRLKHMDERHQHELQEIESGYQHKIMAEVEKYQQLVSERELQKQRCTEQRRLLITTHEKYVNELTEDFESKLTEERNIRIQYEDWKKELQKRFEETKSQLEDDIDTEIERLRKRYDSQLAAEREATLRYKGENGIMNKKFTVLKREIEDQQEEIQQLEEKEQELNKQKEALEKEIRTHKKEIKARDDTIGEKERKIYELKKKNQELEKFKFVLDYKIKDLKKQVEPRETEIANMKEQIKQMDTELEQFHKSNAQLDVMIGDLRNKLDGMQGEILQNRKQIGRQDLTVTRLKSSLHDVVQLIQKPDKLVEAIKTINLKDMQDDIPQQEIDVYVQREYHRHREYLENTLHSLKEKFTRDVEAHRKDNMSIMKENMNLINDIKNQREGNRIAKQSLQAQLGIMQRNGIRQPLNDVPLEEAPAAFGKDEDPNTIIMKNKERIKELRFLIGELELKLVSNRPYSREVLPPMDNFTPISTAPVTATTKTEGPETQA